MKKALLIFAVLAVVASGWLIYFSSDTTLTKVSSVQAKKEDITIKIELTGEVIPVKSYSVMSTLGGKVSGIYVREGDTVHKGQRLLTQDESTALAAMYQNGDGHESMSAFSADAAAGSVQSMLAEEKAKVALALSQTTGLDYESFNEALSGKIKEEAAAASAALNSVNPSAGNPPATTPPLAAGNIAENPM